MEEEKFEKISERAYKKQGFDKFYELPDKYAYAELEDLYRMYRESRISKENSIIQKNKIKNEYDKYKKEYNRIVEIYREYTKNSTDNFELLTKIEKSRDKNEVLIISLQIIQNLINDREFKDRIMTKLDIS